MTTASQLLATLEGINEVSFANEEERVRLRDALFETYRKVQSPWDIVWEHNWVNPATSASIKTLIKAGLFDKWAACGGGSKTCAELAELTGADEVLIQRLMRQISGQNLVVETAADTFTPTPWVTALASDTALQNVYGEFYRGVNTAMFTSLPYFLHSTGFKNPTDLNNGNWQFQKPNGNNFFQDLAVSPEIASDFHCAMQCHSKYNLTPWTEVYPTSTIVEAGIANAKLGRPLVVDVGGSKGHDLEKFRLCHPDVPDGSLVLQDLPDVVQDVKVDKAISVQAYDFFTPQPESARGSRVYFMHNVLHDWTDKLVAKILGNVVGAMEKGYSRLLIHESLVSRVKPLARVTVSDITMMACLSSKERTENEWTHLVEEAGLKVVKIWRPPHSIESVIEAELV